LAGRFGANLHERAYEFALVICDLVDLLPHNQKGWILLKQLFRSGTSIGANLCEANEAISEAEFVHRCSIARKEASETRYWLRLCRDKKLIPIPRIEPALTEVDELIRILVAIIKKTQTKIAE
jgi:four helix bundle protein